MVVFLHFKISLQLFALLRRKNDSIYPLSNTLKNEILLTRAELALKNHIFKLSSV